ncbi:hypothetical protein TNCV_128231 [Trichonephila clavipes]|nr:hypothetical protein TNCV_128231 [Trichonephila clavipes]
MPLSRMENITFAMPSIIVSHDMGLRTVFTVWTPKGKRLFNAYVRLYLCVCEAMSKSKELSEFDRGSIVGCHLCGKSVREIADILQKPKSTVSDVIVKWKPRGSETNR